MVDTVTLRCHTCEQEFTVTYGPGRPRRYCGSSCKEIARKVRRRIRYVERAELRPMAHTPPF